VPGVVGIWHKQNPRPALEEALEALRHLPAWTAETFRLCPGLALGAVRAKKDDAWCRSDSDGLGLLLFGDAFSFHPHPRKLTAQALLASYRESSFDAWRELEGAFVIVLVDTARRRLHLFNDRFGFLPLYYLSGEEMFCFGPEAKAVFKAAGRAPRLSARGVARFIVCACNFGTAPIYEDLRRLEPASVLTLELDSLRLHIRKYWNLVFEPAPKLRLAEAVDLLYEATADSHKMIFCDQPKNVGLLLSGGLDSRCILAMTNRFGLAPCRIISLGARDDLPLSDPAIARQLAGDFGHGFEFLRLDPARLAIELPRWAMLSELANDNYDWCSDGVDTLRFFASSSPDCLVRGDEAWGWCESVRSRDEAVRAVLPSQPGPSCRRVFRADFLTDFTSWYRSEIDRVAAGCQSDDPDNLKDYLYLNIRLFGFIYPLGHIAAVPPRWPLLTLRLLDCVRSFPPEFRSNKVAVRAMMRRKMPEMMRYPLSHEMGRPDWPAVIRDDAPARELFERLLSRESLESCRLGEILDVDGVQAVWRSFLASARSDPADRRKGPMPMWKERLADRMMESPGGAAALERWLRFRNGGVFNEWCPVTDFTVLWRTAMVAALQDALDGAH